MTGRGRVTARGGDRLVAIIILAVVVAYIAFGLTTASNTLGCDFSAYYAAARHWFAGQPIYDLTVSSTGSCGTYQYPPTFVLVAAASAALADQDYFRQNIDRVRATRARLTQAMRHLGFQVTNSQANFVWCTRGPAPPLQLFESLKARGILVRYMNYVGSGDGLRISVGSDAEIDRLIEELERLL